MSLSAQGSALRSFDIEKRLLDLVKSDDIDGVEAILKEKVHPYFKDELGVTPLEISSMRGNVKMSKLLLEYGGDQNPKDKSDSTPLPDAAGGGHVDIKELLLRYLAESQVKVVVLLP
ncbi:hypothetical protein M431DRAFT_486578 [Trichoderma harzianum CBS 226.95]|uniref:Uncharacterized protein n=1 Tax=Trichoderma harzianum CBS 226.95 TaxID=983964 RepID=A0A2T3ZXN8_TRIHA|nr:hypothetical protein M431DRAFT_486578 [Trichoderma harzianum CBS 226.95]PTB49575.1 hypothetical protein M431DRAFT_486578 [Trichoderma harzianum CBS 226.95]